MKSRKLGLFSTGKKKARAAAKSTTKSTLRKGLVETLENRELLAADGFFYPPIGLHTAFLPPSLSYEEYAIRSQAQYGGGSAGGGLTGEGTLGATTLVESEPNNVFTQADPVSVGSGAADHERVTISGILAPSDEEYFVMNLRAGDIFDANASGPLSSIFDLSILDSSRREVIGNNGPIPAGIYPASSALSTGLFGTQLSFVVPADGVYYARLADGDVQGGLNINTPYTLTLSVSRPVLETQPVGTVQKIFLDFDGELVRREAFGATGTARLSPLADFLGGWGLQPEDEERFIRKTVEIFASKFYGPTAISGIGGNGNYFVSGAAGEFGIEILNSFDHADPWGEANVSRIIIGGTQAELLIPTIGIAESVDVGNFNTEESAVVLLDNINALWGGIPRAASVPLEDVLADAVASVAAHEAGHFFSSWHTLNGNASDQIMDTGGNVTGLIGVGPDGIYGTPDDRDVQFGTDTYDPGASAIPFGRQNSAAATAWGLATGKAGGATVTGKTFQDRNSNRAFDSADTGIAGVRVYADANNNSVFDAGEFMALSDATGTYSLVLPAGTYTIRQEVPAGYRVTAPTNNARTISLTAGQTLINQHFGNQLINPTFTGLKWNDANGNQVRDAGEPGIAGVWIYIDEDGDNRIDIGEPSTRTDAQGRYTLVFPGPGTYTIREVIDPGFVQTFPGISDDGDPDNDFEYTITLTGNPATDALLTTGLDFGNRLTVDFGDAPSSYGIASHGLVSGVILGSNWDAEAASQFSTDASGDDVNGSSDGLGGVVDDEDGVSIAFAARNSGGGLTVTASNTSADPAYLQGWIDFDRNGTFESSERIINNFVVGAGTGTADYNISFDVPPTAAIGSTIARFRYSSTQSLPATGAAASGEVEDYVVTIQNELQVAEDDIFDVSRNSTLVENELDVLANDNSLLGLEIVAIGSSRIGATIQISPDNTLRYQPPLNFTGQDLFTYTVQDAAGNLYTANVVININLFFDQPEAIDDSFDVATNAIDFPLNVLENDIEGQNGALTIISVTQPSSGGLISIATGGKSLRYTPSRGFGGTESFTYTVADSAGDQSTAQVTLHTLPGDRADDEVLIEVVATDLNGNPISAIQQGQEFRLNVFVDDLRFSSANPSTAAGVYAAYFDLLYSSQLVGIVPVDTGRFDFEVNFLNDFFAFQTGDASIPGIIDEFGAFNETSLINNPDRVQIATISFTARSPGIAQFTPDPADDLPNSDVLLFDTPGTAIPKERIRYIGTSIEVVGDGIEFPVAVDDSVASAIPSNSLRFPIDVLANDLPGSTGSISITSVSDPLNGQVLIADQGTSDPTDDRILYTPTSGFNGTDQFTYTIQDSRGIQSTAKVTLRVGNVNANDVVSLRLQATDLTGTPIDQVAVGSQFQLRGFVQDLRTAGTDLGIFAAYQDILYSSSLVSPVLSTTNVPDLGFQVQFGANYQEVREGDVRTLGLINEIGAVQTGDRPLGNSEFLLFTITMTANAIGQASFIGDPADISPLHDTLTFEPVAPVGIDLIRYGFDTLNVVASTGGGGGGGEGWTNFSNRMDVNADGFVSPIDVLGVINTINRTGSGPLGGGGGEGESGRLYVDTSADGRLSALDALLVINFLNGRGSGEGEMAAYLSVPAIESSEGEEAIVSVLGGSNLFAEGEDSTTVACPPVGSHGQHGAAFDAIFAEDEEDGLESLLGDLASDVNDEWNNLLG